MKDKRLIAMFLPQFHSFKENDEWWGKGFTEWRNVAQAKPRFKGHYQPRVPADLGYYDLRVPDTRNDQAALARESGIDGFCVYHYWFNGHQLMQRPMEEVLSSKKPDFPFMLCWANENWTRAWDGLNNNILIKQNYSLDDDKSHIQFLIRYYFSDERYIRVYNKPVFVIYRSTLFPNIKNTIEVFREEAAKANMELYICRFENFESYGERYLHDGFDSSIDFQPHFVNYYSYDTCYMRKMRLISLLKKITHSSMRSSAIIDYNEYVDYYMQQYQNPKYKCYPCVTPMWDNSPRRVGKGFFAFRNNTPEKFEEWLEYLLKIFEPFSKEENFVFINAWNEWAEGNYLEPDMKWGRKYLDAVKTAVNKSLRQTLL